MTLGVTVAIPASAQIVLFPTTTTTTTSPFGSSTTKPGGTTTTTNALTSTTTTAPATTIPVPDRPVPTITVAPEPTTEPSDSSTASSPTDATRPFGGVVATTPPTVGGEPLAGAKVVVHQARYARRPLIVSIGGFLTALAMLTVPPLLRRVRDDIKA